MAIGNIAPGNKGAKFEAIRNWFICLRDRGISAGFISLDKDHAEITAARSVWSNAKIQVCMWHVESAVVKIRNFVKFDEKKFAEDCTCASIEVFSVQLFKSDDGFIFCRKCCSNYCYMF
jgi:transposase-like protein